MPILAPQKVISITLDQKSSTKLQKSTENDVFRIHGFRVVRKSWFSDIRDKYIQKIMDNVIENCFFDLKIVEKFFVNPPISCKIAFRFFQTINQIIYRDCWKVGEKQVDVV